MLVCRLDYWTQCELIKCGEYFHISFQPPAQHPTDSVCACILHTRPQKTHNLLIIYPTVFCIVFFIATLLLYFLQNFYNCSHKSYIKYSCNHNNTTTIMHSTSSLIYCVHTAQLRTVHADTYKSGF